MPTEIDRIKAHAAQLNAEYYYRVARNSEYTPRSRALCQVHGARWSLRARRLLRAV